MEKLIQDIKNLDSYYNTSYYTFHLEEPLWKSLKVRNWSGVPYYIKQLCNEVKSLIKERNLTQSEIFQYIADPKKGTHYFFVAQQILSYTFTRDVAYSDIYSISCGEKEFPTNITIDEDLLFCVATCFVLDRFRYDDLNIKSVISYEKHMYDINDYKLTKIENLDFKQNGFIYDKKYYLYNIFIDKSPLNINSLIPAVFEIMSQNIDFNKSNFYLRLDERLAVPLKYAYVSTILKFQKWRGCTFDFSNTKLENLKNIIVHGDNDNYNKLLMVIKKRYDDILDEEFWHIEIEELPYIDRGFKSNKDIITTFIHGKYYPKRKAFRHIDFIKNQYPFKEYCSKQEDNSTNEIKIDFYTTKECHYKVWCIENIDIQEHIWCELVNVSLSEEYRKLFGEILDSSK
ncbi:Uncharacterised protein [Clostridioides difficile]|nr:Uncharacterised protein [Clostridioides difficile]